MLPNSPTLSRRLGLPTIATRITNQFPTLLQHHNAKLQNQAMEKQHTEGDGALLVPYRYDGTIAGYSSCQGPTGLLQGSGSCCCSPRCSLACCCWCCSWAGCATLFGARGMMLLLCGAAGGVLCRCRLNHACSSASAALIRSSGVLNNGSSVGSLRLRDPQTPPESARADHTAQLLLALNTLDSSDQNNHCCCCLHRLFSSKPSMCMTRAPRNRREFLEWPVRARSPK